MHEQFDALIGQLMHEQFDALIGQLMHEQFVALNGRLNWTSDHAYTVYVFRYRLTWAIARSLTP